MAGRERSPTSRCQLSRRGIDANPVDIGWSGDFSVIVSVQTATSADRVTEPDTGPFKPI